MKPAYDCQIVDEYLFDQIETVLEVSSICLLRKEGRGFGMDWFFERVSKINSVLI
jgi:hypothetical protein